MRIAGFTLLIRLGHTNICFCNEYLKYFGILDLQGSCLLPLWIIRMYVSIKNILSILVYYGHKAHFHYPFWCHGYMFSY